MHKHHEVHLALTPEDADLFALAGLPEISKDTEICFNCGAEVGCTPKRFVPLALVLSEDTDGVLCITCVSPVIRT
jgi:hypothetical protein